MASPSPPNSKRGSEWWNSSVAMFYTNMPRYGRWTVSQNRRNLLAASANRQACRRNRKISDYDVQETDLAQCCPFRDQTLLHRISKSGRSRILGNLPLLTRAWQAVEGLLFLEHSHLRWHYSRRRNKENDRWFLSNRRRSRCKLQIH